MKLEEALGGLRRLEEGLGEAWDRLGRRFWERLGRRFWETWGGCLGFMSQKSTILQFSSNKPTLGLSIPLSLVHDDRISVMWCYVVFWDGFVYFMFLFFGKVRGRVVCVPDCFA